MTFDSLEYIGHTGENVVVDLAPSDGGQGLAHGAIGVGVVGGQEGGRNLGYGCMRETRKHVA